MFGYGYSISNQVVMQRLGAATDSADPYLGQVATRSTIPTNRNSSNTEFNSRTGHTATDNISALQVELPYWLWNRKNSQTEEAPDGSINFRAAIEYPEGTYTQVLFSGSAEANVGGGGYVLSDEVDVSIPQGDTFWVRVFGDATNEMVFLDGDDDLQVADTGMGDRMEYGGDGEISDKTMGGSFTSTGSGPAAPIYFPSAIVAQTTKPSFLILGDSKADGFKDEFSAEGLKGEIERLIGTDYGFINTASSGDTIQDQKNVIRDQNSSRRVDLNRYVSHVIYQTAINNLRSDGSGLGKSAAVALSQQQKIFDEIPSDKTIYVTTTAGSSESSDGFATAGGQTANSNQSEIAAYNDAVRQIVPQASGYVEIADFFDTARNSGIWKAGYTNDGLHPTPISYAALADSISEPLLKSSILRTEPES